MILYVHPAAGVSGDMLLAALMDLGLPAAKVSGALRRLGRGPVPHRAEDLIRRVRGSRLPAPIKKDVLRIWTLLARAEGRSHRCPWGDVRFHQLARPAAMRNVVGFCAALSHFRIRRVYTGPVPMGKLWRDPSGRIRREEGPTASRLLAAAHLPVTHRPEAFEWTTPTGAALLAAFARPHPPPLRVLRIGHGTGLLRPPGVPRPLRLLLAERVDTSGEMG